MYMCKDLKLTTCDDRYTYKINANDLGNIVMSFAYLP